MHISPCIYFTIICLLFHTIASQQTCAPLTPEEVEKLSASDLVTKLTAPCRYDRWLRPDPGDGRAIHVHARVHVYFLGEIQAQSLKFTAHILLMYRWRDPRLAYPRKTKDGTNIGPISGQGLLLKDKIWIPHVYLSNERDSVVMGPEKRDIRITLHPDGTVQQSQRMKVTLYCLMNLQKFPFDQQQCPLVLESWTYNTSDLRLSWETHRPVSVNTELLLTEYRLIDTRTLSAELGPGSSKDPPHPRLSPPNATDPSKTAESEDTTYSIVNEISESAENEDFIDYSSEDFGFYKNLGNFSVLEIRFHLAREVGHYVMDYFMPSILLVGMSWVSFWLDPNAIPGRTTLGTSTMLTFITLTRNTGSALPKVSYIKATEVWFIVCTAFIFGSLLEFAFVNTIWRRKKEVALKKVNSKYILKSTLTPRMARRAMSSSGSVGADLDRCQSWPRVDGKTNPANDVTFYLNSNAPNQLTVNSMDSIRMNGDNSNNGGAGFDSCATLTSTTSAAQMDEDCHSVIIPVPGENAPPAKPFTKMTPQEVAHWIDVRSRFWFPVAFLLFNALYWGFVWI